MCKGSHFIRHKEEMMCFFSISYTKKLPYVFTRAAIHYGYNQVTCLICLDY